MDARKIGGYAILYVGMTGAGKTSVVKDNIRNVHPDRLEVYDVQREYFPDVDELPKIEDFQKTVMQLRRGHAVFEEGTIFFSNRGRDENMIKILVDKRHHENVIHICFHGIADIPGNIFRLVNYVYIFQTNDTGAIVEQRYPKLFEAWDVVNNRPTQADKFRLPNGLYTPYKLVQLQKTATLLK